MFSLTAIVELIFKYDLLDQVVLVVVVVVVVVVVIVENVLI